MEHRHFLGRSWLNSDTEQICNNCPSNSQLNLVLKSPMAGTDSFMFPTDLAVHAYPNTSSGTNFLPLPNHMPGVPGLMIENNTRTSYDPSMNPTIGTCSQFLSHYIQHSPCYEYVGVWDVNTGHDNQAECYRSAYKRKASVISYVERENPSAYHSHGSSSNYSSSAERLQAEGIRVPQHWHSELLNAVHSYGSKNLPVPDEGFQRNVRSRHGNCLHLGVSSSNLSPRNLSLDSQSGECTSSHVVTEQRNHTASLVSHTVHTSEINNFAYEVDLLPNYGNFDHNGKVDSVEQCQSSSLHRNVTPFPMSIDGLPQEDMIDHGSSNQRMTPWIHTDYPPLGLAGNMDDTRPRRNENIVPARYSRPVSILGHASERNVRVRNRRVRFSFSDENAHARWVSDGIAMADQSAYYHSGNLFDQHQDMRLDIDGMTYEELLALEDRIGYVNTGLSEDAMSSCLIVSIYCSSDRVLEGSQEDKCVICLDSYKDGEDMGRLKCRHDFHASCVKEWLLIKKTCPICKESALEDNSKGQ